MKGMWQAGVQWLAASILTIAAVCCSPAPQAEPQPSVVGDTKESVVARATSGDKAGGGSLDGTRMAKLALSMWCRREFMHSLAADLERAEEVDGIRDLARAYRLWEGLEPSEFDEDDDRIRQDAFWALLEHSEDVSTQVDVLKSFAKAQGYILSTPDPGKRGRWVSEESESLRRWLVRNSVETPGPWDEFAPEPPGPCWDESAP